MIQSKTLDTAETVGEVLRRRAGKGIPPQISMEQHDGTSPFKMGVSIKSWYGGNLAPPPP